MPAPIGPSYNRSVDDYSREIFRQAAKLATDPKLSVADRQQKIEALAQQQVSKLRDDLVSGRVTRDQFDGGVTALNGLGGELGEIQDAARIAKDLLGTADGAKKLSQNPLLFTSDKFNNLTLTGQAKDGELVHVRLGTHGDVSGKAANPQGDGFPFPGSKWVEGDIVVGSKVYSFVDQYTDNFKVDVDASGNPTAIRFRGEVDVKEPTAEVLTKGDKKWTASLPPTTSTGRAVLELTIPLQATPGRETNYGLKDFGFEDINRALTTQGGQVTITPLDEAGKPGEPKTLDLSSASGQMETGVYKNVPRGLPTAYNFVQGQRIDTSKVFARALASEPQAVAALLTPGSPLRKEVEKVASGGTAAPDLAARVDEQVRARATTDPQLRRAAAPLLIRSLAAATLPEATKDQQTVTRFEGRLLGDDLASRLVSRLIGPALDEAGALSADGTFTSYEPNALVDLFSRNKDVVDPVAVLNVNDVPLYIDGKDTPARLERRTDLLFDTRSGQFLLGFQEVFHEK